MENLLSKKLKLKPGSRAALLNAPVEYPAALGELPQGVEPQAELDGDFDWILLFARSQAELGEYFPGIERHLRPDSLLWIAFPKGSSGIQSDLTRDRGWERLEPASLKWINLVSLDETWSAFGLRPYKPGEKHESPMRR